MSSDELPEDNRELYEDGERCLGKVLQHLIDWHVAEYCIRIGFSNRSKTDQEKILQDWLDVERWLSAVGTQRAIHDQRELKEIKNKLIVALQDEDFKNNSINDWKAAMGRALLLVKTITSSQNSSAVDNPRRFVTVPNTVFIMIAMCPELKDACSTIKGVCRCFRKRAFRADEVPHNGQINEVVYKSIATSELLIADLTGEKPNVYHEVGIARGLDKEPVLVCKKGTTIHFNLVGNNVIEYDNCSELKKLLQARLKGMYKAA